MEEGRPPGVKEFVDEFVEVNGSRRTSVAPTETSNCGVVVSSSNDDERGGGGGVAGEGRSTRVD